MNFIGISIHNLADVAPTLHTAYYSDYILTVVMVSTDSYNGNIASVAT
jgi:hypothetical protein